MRVLPGSGDSGALEACSYTAVKKSGLQDALTNHLVYQRLSQPQSKCGLPAIHGTRQWGHSYFHLEALYQYSQLGQFE